MCSNRENCAYQLDYMTTPPHKHTAKVRHNAVTLGLLPWFGPSTNYGGLVGGWVNRLLTAIHWCVATGEWQLLPQSDVH